ncbi:hypothetical protein AVEN_149223-1 [Araneus ventricosus]|uniref:Uncharacterized protein n=1 Tax=Araneus ventricosus TaxID=182803 RepID=A0A4Y2LNT1_ARAVE|nr:hypothetical protein AVEN_149223-1 [Araneus ventricosus]
MFQEKACCLLDHMQQSPSPEEAEDEEIADTLPSTTRKNRCSRFKAINCALFGPRWPSGKSQLPGQRVPGSKPDFTEDPLCMLARCTLNHTQ